MGDFKVSLSDIQKKNLTDKCSIVSKLANYIRVNNINDINTCLIQLKDDTKRYHEFIKQSNGLDILVQLLCYKNPIIVNMSLSILADACMIHHVREKLKDTMIGSNVLSIIENLKLEDKLHCRACRLISNLSECKWHANKLFDIGVMKLLVELLKSKISLQTYLMAVRVIRLIWNNHEKGREKMLVKYEIVKLVTEIFIMAMETSKKNIKYIELVDACLKAMYVFFKLDRRYDIQIQVDQNKQSYKYLVQCCSTDFRFNNKVAMKYLHSLCRIAECRLLLGQCGMIEQLIVLIDSISSISGNLSEEMLVSLYWLCWESVNRARVTNNNGLQLFLKLLKMSEYKRYHFIFLYALICFYYDDNAIDILSKHDIIEILAAQLTNMVTMVANSSKSNILKKHSITNDHSFKEKALKHLKTNSLTRYSVQSSMDYYRDNWSPKSSTSGYSSSPPSTPPLAHYSNFDTKTDDMDDNIYSPVCSDTEYGDNDDELTAEEKETISLKSYKSLTIETDNSSDSDTSNKIYNRNMHMSHATLMLLTRLSLWSKPIDKLADPIIIKPLLNYIKYTKNNKASKILIRIVGQVSYFVPLVEQSFVFEVQDLLDPEQYMQPFRIIAEIGSSIGELSSIMLRETEEKTKVITALSIPLLIRTYSILKDLLINKNGLKLIFHALSESDLQKRAIWSICQLAKTLQIHSETIVDRSTTTTVTTNDDRLCDYVKPTVSSTVTFELDDGMTVEACRRTLCQRSDVFSAMLEGHFSESGKKQVRLKNTSCAGLSTLILAINNVALEDRSIESILDAVLLADKFLMPDLSAALTEHFTAILNHENFNRSWCWAKKNSCDEVRLYCIKSFLSAKMSLDETIYAFSDFYASGIFDEFLCEVKEIIMDAICRRNH